MMLSVKSEFDLPVYYKNEQIGLRINDFLVNDLICVEIKAVSNLDDVHLAQALNYLEASGKEVGLLINFGSPSLQFKRLQIRIKKYQFFLKIHLNLLIVVLFALVSIILNQKKIKNALR